MFNSISDIDHHIPKTSQEPNLTAAFIAASYSLFWFIMKLVYVSRDHPAWRLSDVKQTNELRR